MKLTPQPLITFLLALNQAYRNLGFYPPGHPGLKGAADRIDQTLKPLFSSREIWSLGCGREGFLLEDKPLAGGPVDQFKKMAFELFLRRVKQLFIHRDVTGGEMLDFIGLLLVSKEELAKTGGVDEYLKSRDIAHVRIDEADFSHLSTTSEVQAPGETQPEEPPPPSTVKEIDTNPLRKEHNKLLFELTKQEKDEDYQTLLNKVVHLSHALREHGVLEPSLQTLQMLVMHTSNPKISAGQKKISEEAIPEVFNEGLLEYLIGRLGKFSEFELEELGKIMQSIGDHAIPMIWTRFDKLAEHPESRQLPPMIQMVYWLGDSTREEIEKRLETEQVSPAVARLIRMRGEMPDSHHLMKLLTRGHPEVRRELRRLLADLGGEDALRMLAQSVNAIAQEDIPELVECIAQIDLPQTRKRLAALLGRYMDSQPKQSLEIQKAVLRIMGKKLHPDYPSALNRFAKTLAKVPRETAREMYPLLLSTLCEYRDNESLATLTEIIDHDDEEIRQDAWESLSALAAWMDPPNTEENHA